MDWKTIKAFLGLLILVSGLQESGYLQALIIKALKKVKTKRALALSVTFVGSFFSMFLTNDVTLFILVGLMLPLRVVLGSDFLKLIVFEVIAVNVGSSLSCLGNPQNLFLWHKWGISFVDFVLGMLPMVVILFVILFLFVYLFFPNERISFWGQRLEEVSSVNRTFAKWLFVTSLLGLLCFIFALDFGWVDYILLPIVVLYLCIAPKVLIRVDWMFLLTLGIVFIDFHIIGSLPIISYVVSKFDLSMPQNVFLIGLFLSQLMGNVPASVFVTKFSNNWWAVSYGVNVGGNGLIWASFANLISLRVGNLKEIFFVFHKYSLCFLIVSGIAVYFLTGWLIP